MKESVNNLGEVEMDIKKEKELFNVWYYEKHTGCDYDSCWSGWLAAKQQAVPKGYCVVPIDPSETMQEIGMLHIPTVDCQPYDAGMVYKAMIQEAQK